MEFYENDNLYKKTQKFKIERCYNHKTIECPKCGLILEGVLENDTKCIESEQFMNGNIDYKRECEVLALQLHLLREEYNTLKHELEMLKQYYEEQNEVNTKFISKSKIEELVKQLEQDDINITKKYTEGKGLKCYLSDIDRVRIRAYRTKTRGIKERIQKILEGD